MSYMHGFQHRRVSWLKAVVPLDVLDQPGLRKGLLIRTHGDEGGESVLVDSIQQVQVLALPVGGGEGLLLQGCIRSTA